MGNHAGVPNKGIPKEGVPNCAEAGAIAMVATIRMMQRRQRENDVTARAMQQRACLLKMATKW